MRIRHATLLFVSIMCLVMRLPTLFAEVPATTAPVAGRETLVIGAVKVNDSVTKSAKAEGRENQLARVADAMDTQFRSALGATRKFELLVGSDLADILAMHHRLEVQKAAADSRAVADLVAAKYVVVLTIDDFQDIQEKLTQSGQVDMTARRIRISVVATIYNIQSGEILDTVNMQVQDRKFNAENPDVSKTGDAKDQMLLDLTKQSAWQSANRVVDVFFPARILSRDANVVTINRGDGTNINAGEVWEVFTLGQEIKDPDTGEILGHEETPSGRVRVTVVYPKFSKADILDEKKIAKGDMLHLHVEQSVPTTRDKK